MGSGERVPFEPEHPAEGLVTWVMFSLLADEWRALPRGSSATVVVRLGFIPRRPGMVLLPRRT